MAEPVERNYESDQYTERDSEDYDSEATTLQGMVTSEEADSESDYENTDNEIELPLKPFYRSSVSVVRSKYESSDEEEGGDNQPKRKTLPEVKTIAMNLDDVNVSTAVGMDQSAETTASSEDDSSDAETEDDPRTRFFKRGNSFFSNTRWKNQSINIESADSETESDDEAQPAPKFQRKQKLPHENQKRNNDEVSQNESELESEWENCRERQCVTDEEMSVISDATYVGADANPSHHEEIEMMDVSNMNEDHAEQNFEELENYSLRNSCSDDELKSKKSIQYFAEQIMKEDKIDYSVRPKMTMSEHRTIRETANVQGTTSQRGEENIKKQFPDESLQGGRDCEDLQNYSMRRTMSGEETVSMRRQNAHLYGTLSQQRGQRKKSHPLREVLDEGSQDEDNLEIDIDETMTDDDVSTLRGTVRTYAKSTQRSVKTLMNEPSGDVSQDESECDEFQDYPMLRRMSGEERSTMHRNANFNGTSFQQEANNLNFPKQYLDEGSQDEDNVASTSVSRPLRGTCRTRGKSSQRSAKTLMNQPSGDVSQNDSECDEFQDYPMLRRMSGEERSTMRQNASGYGIPFQVERKEVHFSKQLSDEGTQYKENIQLDFEHLECNSVHRRIVTDDELSTLCGSARELSQRLGKNEKHFSPHDLYDGCQGEDNLESDFEQTMTDDDLSTLRGTARTRETPYQRSVQTMKNFPDHLSDTVSQGDTYYEDFQNYSVCRSLTDDELSTIRGSICVDDDRGDDLLSEMEDLETHSQHEDNFREYFDDDETNSNVNMPPDVWPDTSNEAVQILSDLEKMDLLNEQISESLLKPNDINVIDSIVKSALEKTLPCFNKIDTAINLLSTFKQNIASAIQTERPGSSSSSETHQVASKPKSFSDTNITASAASHEGEIFVSKIPRFVAFDQLREEIERSESSSAQENEKLNESNERTGTSKLLQNRKATRKSSLPNMRNPDRHEVSVNMGAAGDYDTFSISSSKLNHGVPSPSVISCDSRVQGASVNLSKVVSKAPTQNKPKGGSNRKNLSFSNERLYEIQRHNLILLKKIESQKPSYCPGITKNNPPPAAAARLSSAAINRKKLQRQIDMENQMFKRKLQAIHRRS